MSSAACDPSSETTGDFSEIINEIAGETLRSGPTPSERDSDDADMLELPSAPQRSNTPIAKEAAAFIIASEISSEAAYNAKYTHPIWPGGNSGVTIGIGYDVGTVSAILLASDWAGELAADVVKRLSTSCGVLGPSAAGFLAKFRDITVPYAVADRVFFKVSLPQFVAHTERALANTAQLHPDSLGALVSLTYNRGASFNKPGDRYREMRAIRDHMADRRFDLIPGELRAMKRIWAGLPNLRGLVLRREAEAELFERGLKSGAGRVAAAPLESFSMAPAAPVALEGLASWVVGWLKPIVEEPTRNHLMFQLPRPQPDEGPIVKDENYVAVRVLSARIANGRRWTSLYHGAVHATSSMLYEGVGQSRIERQSVLAPDGFRDIDPKGQGKLLQVDRPLFGPMPYRGDLRLSVALFSVKSSDLAAPYLSLISQLSQTVTSGFVTAAQPFIGPLKQASDLLFGASDAASLECGVVRGFEPLKPGVWVSIGATADEVGPTDGFRLDPQDGRLLDGAGQTFDGHPYIVFEIQKLTERDDWMEIPALKTAWDALTTALGAGKLDEAKTAAANFRHLCLASSDLIETDGARLIAKAARKLALAQQDGLESPSFGSLRGLDLYGVDEEPRVHLDEDAHVDPDEPSPAIPPDVLEALMPWRIAKALLKLRDQVNALAQQRSKKSDGAIGDAAHATRNSDHNPWIVDGGIGVVSAIDLTNDPSGGFSADKLAEALRTARDVRVKYVIWNRRIFSSTTSPWTWRPYNGASPHDKHIHISVRADKPHYDDASPWAI
ncbi:hypothetical protein M2323_003764 [Rhodoblastus acidophilus]|uniref:hypothetical protein n=1 Tax=Rhodoblastus acidophilus TaxID=1074 RepID=UPI0022257174|nr:hypothetical protein [Rhodoblastus acidophilus]MCW2285927.1 hypothetical protein [Rhodoblastus acidophilus]MCW2334821.1 hypothetical protein [Rhodoblastus acidophilus]